MDGPNLMTQDSLPVLHYLQFLGPKIWGFFCKTGKKSGKRNFLHSMPKTSFQWQLAKGTWAAQFCPQQAGSSLHLTFMAYTDGCFIQHFEFRFFSPNLSFYSEFLNYSGLSIRLVRKGAGLLDRLLCVINFKTTSGSTVCYELCSFCWLQNSTMVF